MASCKREALFAVFLTAKMQAELMDERARLKRFGTSFNATRIRPAHSLLHLQGIQRVFMKAKSVRSYKEPGTFSLTDIIFWTWVPNTSLGVSF